MKILLVVTVIFCSLISYSQKKTNYIITAEANALMCPFLSPKLISSIEKNGGKSVVKTKELSLLFYCEKSTVLTEARILELVDDIGYDPRMFKVEMKEEE
jgi:hypothetical protein